MNYLWNCLIYLVFNRIKLVYMLVNNENIGIISSKTMLRALVETNCGQIYYIQMLNSTWIMELCIGVEAVKCSKWKGSYGTPFI